VGSILLSIFLNSSSDLCRNTINLLQNRVKKNLHNTGDPAVTVTFALGDGLLRETCGLCVCLCVHGYVFVGDTYAFPDSKGKAIPLQA
jgi:hypothetical protein